MLDDIKASLSALTFDAVLSVASSGKTITVSEVDGNVNVDVNTMSVADAKANGYVAIEKVAETGALYGVMYYGGDDMDGIE